MAFRIFVQRRERNDGDQEEGEGEEERLLLRVDVYSSDEEEEEDSPNVDINEVGGANGQDYDISLPAQHLYLGNLEEEGVASVQDEETTPTLPLYYSSHILFPEETLPLHIFNPHAIAMLRDASTAHKPVAVCTDLREGHTHLSLSSRRPQIQELAPYGTTAEIVACREDEEGAWFHGPKFVVKFKGRQRFKLLEVTKKVNGMMECKVEILPDALVLPRPPLLLPFPPSLACSYEGMFEVARLPEATPLSAERAAKCRQIMNLPSHCMSSCSVPEWTLRKYELDHLRQEVLRAQQLNSLSTEGTGADPLPIDITSLSFWLSRRLPVDDNTKMKFLQINCPTQRLMLGLKLLKENTELYCNGCGLLITQKEFIFSMSLDGPLASYVNEGGFVHETLSVTKAFNLKFSGRATAENSWFPGYKWTIVNCRGCKDHKGWCFDAVNKELVPLRFYGLRRPGLVFSVKKKLEQLSNET